MLGNILEPIKKPNGSPSGRSTFVKVFAEIEGWLKFSVTYC